MLMLVSCGTTSSEPISKSMYLLDTKVTITIYDSDKSSLLTNSFNLCDKYTQIFSNTDQNSELYKLNHRMTNTVEVSADLASLIKTGLKYSELTDGDFDITIYPLSSLYDFHDQNNALPDQAAIAAAITKIDYHKVSVNGNAVTFADNATQIDLGALAKGYIADKLKSYLTSKGVKSAIIDLGGNIVCIGERPDSDTFKIGIAKPFTNTTALTLNINDLSVVTSGIYQRYIKVKGKIYHHILNPHTGYSYENDLASVSIISKDSTNGDALSTTCFIMGKAKATKYIESLKDTYAIFITKSGKIYYTKGTKKFVN